MKKELENILNKLDIWIGKTKEDSYENSYAFNSRCELTILGQMGLLVDEKIAAKL